jgi:hypothetical protein
MLLLLIASLFADWRYGGFASDPAPSEPVDSRPAQPVPVVVAPEPDAVAPPASLVAPPPPPAAPPPPPAAPPDADKPPVAEPPLPSIPRPAPKKPRTIRVEAPPQPSLWHLADRSGQVWEDPDPDRLRRWVAYRDASLTAARPGPLSRVRKVILTRRHFQSIVK